MNVFELFWFAIHIAVFAVVSALVGSKFGWLAGLGSGAGAVAALIAIERLLAAIGTRIAQRRRASDGAR